MSVASDDALKVTRDMLSFPVCRLRTLPEVLELALASQQKGKHVGVYIETKGPAFHKSIGLPLEGKLVEALAGAGYKEATDAPLILQSFEEPVHTSLYLAP